VVIPPVAGGGVGGDVELQLAVKNPAMQKSNELKIFNDIDDLRTKLKFS
jgi:hypothetical protein